MIYAPIIIPTLCRDKHFIRLIESLKKNTWAKHTEVFVGLDYPSSEKHEEGWNQICKYLDRGDFSAFRGFKVIRHTQNVGSFKNNDLLQEEVLKKYDRWIRTDDDVEFSPDFLEYMDRCLMEYEEDDNIIAVAGYSYPIEWTVSSKSTVFQESFICPMWGTGFWKKKREKIEDYIRSGRIQQSMNNASRQAFLGRMLDVAKIEYINLCLSHDFKMTLAGQFTDVALRMYMAINNKYVVMPTMSKVRNWGFDGTGEYCGKIEGSGHTSRTYCYERQPIDQKRDFELIPDTLMDNQSNRNKMNSFDRPNRIFQIKANIKYSLCKILGVEMVSKLLYLSLIQKTTCLNVLKERKILP